MTYSPKNLTRLTEPVGALGETWPQYFSSGVGESRWSGVVERSNFASMLRALGGETSTVKVVLCFVDLIAIHESDAKALKIADDIIAAMADSCIIDIEHFERIEQEEADLTWKTCFDSTQRIAFIRRFRRDLQFYDLADLIGCVRGKYFRGDAAELR